MSANDMFDTRMETCFPGDDPILRQRFPIPTKFESAHGDLTS
jgi:hypothetical protein